MADLLSTYVQHHLAAARGGLDLFRRAAANHRQSSIAQDLSSLALDVEHDLMSLRQIASDLGAQENVLMSAAARIGERVGRLKTNGSLFHRTALTSVMEVEGLRDAVAAKAAGWDALSVAATNDARIDADAIAGLKVRAADQLQRLIELHARTAETAFDTRIADPRG